MAMRLDNGVGIKKKGKAPNPFKKPPIPGGNGWSVTVDPRDDPISVPTRPKGSSPAAPKPYTSTKTSSRTSTSKGKGSRTSGSSGSSSGSSAEKKMNDAPQLAALQKMIDSSFGSARDTKLGNVIALLSQQDSELLKGYSERALGLAGSREDNEKSESSGTFANLLNRARELTDLSGEVAAQGAGESDTLKVQLQALRNWSANQSDVNRSYFDTVRSVNAAVTDLNADTRSARMNLHSQALGDQEQIWANYYNQMADAYTQMGNIRGNPFSDSYQAGSDSFGKAAEMAGQSWKSPGIPAAVAGWQGTEKPRDGVMNNTAYRAATDLGAAKKKAPEGATLRKW